MLRQSGAPLQELTAQVGLSSPVFVRMDSTTPGLIKHRAVLLVPLESMRKRDLPHVSHVRLAPMHLQIAVIAEVARLENILRAQANHPVSLVVVGSINQTPDPILVSLVQR